MIMQKNKPIYYKFSTQIQYSILYKQIIKKTLQQILDTQTIHSRATTLENGIKILNKISYYNYQQCEIVLKENMIQTIEKILSQVENLINFKDHNQILFETVSLINAITNLRDKAPLIISRLFQYSGISKLLISEVQEFSNAQEKIQLFNQNPFYLQQIINMVFTHFPDVYSNCNNRMTKYLILNVIEKIMTFSTQDQIQNYCQDRKMVQFLIQLSQSEDLLIIANFLLIIKTNFQKIPSFLNYVRRDGMMEELKKLSIQDFSNYSLNSVKNIKTFRIDEGQLDGFNNELNLFYKKIVKFRELAQKETKKTKSTIQAKTETTSQVDHQKQVSELRQEIKLIAQEIYDSIPQEQETQQQIIKQFFSLIEKIQNCQNQGLEVIQDLQQCLINFEELTKTQIQNSNFVNALVSFMTNQEFGAIRCQEILRILQTEHNMEPLMNQFVIILIDLLNSNKKIQKLNEVQQEENMIQEFKILLNRSNFMVKYQPFKNEDQTKNKNLLQIYKRKHTIFNTFKQIAIQLEQYGTLEAVEEYLLNKLTFNELYNNNDLFNNDHNLLRQMKKLQDLDFRQHSKSMDATYTKNHFSQSQDAYSENQYSQDSLDQNLLFDESKENQDEDSQDSDEEEIDLQNQKNSIRRISEDIKFIDKRFFNFKKYLSINFYMNKQKIDKNKSLFEMKSMFSDNMTLDFSLNITSQVKAESKPQNVQIYDTKEKAFQYINDQLQTLDLNDFEDQQLIDIIKLLHIVKTINEYSNIYGYKPKILPIENSKISRLIQRLFLKPIFVFNPQKSKFYKKICQCLPFILDFDTKVIFYKSVNFQVNRYLSLVINNHKSKLQDQYDNDFQRMGRLSRKKLKVQRENILSGSINNLLYFHSQNALMEFDFQNEEGSGLGPTLEYYQEISSELQNPILNIWRKTDRHDLFPSPYQTFKHQEYSLMDIFEFLGVLIARSIIDNRIMQVNISPVFWKLLLSKPMTKSDLYELDFQLATQIFGLDESVGDLSIFFMLPGYDIELIENGQYIQVKAENLELFQQKVLQCYLIDSVQVQVNAFLSGFQKVNYQFEVLDLKQIGQLIEYQEINKIFSGTQEMDLWSVSDLQDNILPAYGYTKQSEAYKNFIQILSEMEIKNIKLFLKFLTGCSTLPFGGLKNLNPKITVVKKLPYQSNQNPDNILPSVMTCQNYIKLPEYSSIEICKERIYFAINEGQNNFSLS